MRRWQIARAKFAVLVFCALALFVGVPAAAQEAGATQEIQMTAKKYEFNPNLITVKKGTHVKLIITALDRDHGFKLEAFGINQKLKKGDPTTIEFTADKVGTFPFQCSVFCGMGHRRMKGKLVVEE
jgi:cytochrome c oxidase subunit 2